MARAPFQVLVFPYIILPGRKIRYAVFKREISGRFYWQAVAGGGEDNETPAETARREMREETGINPESEFIVLDSMATVPVIHVCGFAWGDDVLVLPQHCFGAEVGDTSLTLSDEHLEYRWLEYNDAHAILSWDSNRHALWELDLRLRRMIERGMPILE